MPLNPIHWSFKTKYKQTLSFFSFLCLLSQTCMNECILSMFTMEPSMPPTQYHHDKFTVCLPWDQFTLRPWQPPSPLSRHNKRLSTLARLSARHISTPWAPGQPCVLPLSNDETWQINKNGSALGVGKRKLFERCNPNKRPERWGIPCRNHSLTAKPERSRTEHADKVFVCRSLQVSM